MQFQVLKEAPHCDCTSFAAADWRLVAKSLNFEIQKGVVPCNGERAVSGLHKLRLDQLVQDVKAALKHDLAQEAKFALSKLAFQQAETVEKWKQLDTNIFKDLAACIEKIREQGLQFSQGMQTLHHEDTESMTCHSDAFFERPKAFHQNQAVKSQETVDQRMEETNDGLRSLV